ncbi:hypothetical protein M422DRAFT_267121 [Sphaerobolus stellatus SS14]|uniref:Uncharacterized protein n=1 Tax=Sphaerobolus stellatus (strain SS14) TaxID=990650 RepID=A0A0C9V1G8_SPHS4|nr:hypothetical protein M422DRAFT_267121 [Sphaerobolus stellatus SS14]
MSQATCSGNAAELLLRFHEQQARRNEHRIEVGIVFGACFIYHLIGCDRCSSCLEHLLEDIEQHPSKFSFSKDEIMNGLHEAWPHLRGEMDDLKERIQELEAQVASLQPSSTLSERLMAPTDTTESPVGSAHPLYSPPKVNYARKHSRRLDENEDFRNHVLKREARPDHWSLHMWQALVGWHKNPMSMLNALREDLAGFFLEEDVDVAAWLNKVGTDLPRQAFMNRMKAIFGSRINFETAFSGFDLNLLRSAFQQSQWITDSSTPLRLESHPTKGLKDKSQAVESVKIPTGSDFLKLILDHCSLSKEQIYNRIIPYMIRDEEKRPLSAAAMERAAYMTLRQHPPAPNKGKKSLTGRGQSMSSVHAPQPAKVGQSSQQQLDADLEAYSQHCEPVLPYSEAPPSGEPESENNAPSSLGASSTLPDESTMDIDPELADLYS